MLDTIQPFAESINPDGKKKNNASVLFTQFCKSLLVVHRCLQRSIFPHVLS